MGDSHGARGERGLDDLEAGRAEHALRAGLEQHREVAARDDVDVVIRGSHDHGLVEGRPAHEVAEDDGALGVLGGSRDGVCDGIGIGRGLILEEGDGREVLLGAGDHLERARHARSEGRMSGDDEIDHVHLAFPPRRCS